MARIYDGPESAIWEVHTNQKLDLGTALEFDDGRLFRYALIGGTSTAAGSLYQSVAALAGHTNIAVDVARAVGAQAVSATLNTTAAAVDIYSEGFVHINDATGEGYSYKIKRAYSVGDAHASATSTGVLTVNLKQGVTVQIALVASTSEVAFTRNPYHSVIIHPSPPTAGLAGVAPGIITNAKYGWLQRKGICAVLGDLTPYVGNELMASRAVNGAVEGWKALITTGATSASDETAFTKATDSAGSETTVALGEIAISTVADITGGIANRTQVKVGVCIKANADTEYILADLQLE